MAPGAALAIVLVVAGAVLGAGGLIVIGILMGLIVALRSVWSRYGFRALVYERRVSAHRMLWGERIDLDLVVRNAKPLPLPWLQIDDLVTHGADVVGHRLSPSARQGFDILRGTWSVGWFERVTRRLQVVGSRRGTFRFVSTTLRIADVFTRDTETEERSIATTYRVVPRIVPVRSLLTQSPAMAATRAARGLYEEPSLFAGVRPYQPGDQLRRIHWKATARVGRPVSRRFDPAREREIMLAVDIQTIPGASWMLNWDDDMVESLCVASLSLARSFIEDGVAVGLAVNAFTDRPQRTVYVPPSAGPGQVGTIADLLADVSPYPSVGFTQLLAGIGRVAPSGCSIVGLSARDPSDFVAVLLRLNRQGFYASLAAIGPDAGAWIVSSRSVGLPGAAYRLDPDWRTADALERVA
jgi:uncharacterized protein (DUF58 family)